ncbi:MAG: hypothetical protein O3A00_18470 [Planctomycetota bacterium]|nr:hypothetical protein [Planctomycetota bacterium]
MNEKSTIDAKLILTEEFDEWFHDPREFIVEARLPRRQVLIAHTGIRRSPREIVSEPGNRAAELERVAHQVEAVVPGSMNILQSAGAIAVRALPAELRAIALIPGVRTIRANRHIP